MVLICWVPIGLLLTIKQGMEMFNNIKKKHQTARSLRPVFRKVVEDSLKSGINFSYIKSLKDKSENGDIDPPITNPREIYYKDTRY